MEIVLMNELKEAILSKDKHQIEIEIIKFLNLINEPILPRTLEDMVCSGNPQGRLLIRESIWELIAKDKIQFNYNWSLIIK